MTPSIAPESPSQAANWDRTKRRAVEAGLCHTCASQLAWGSQNGFATVHEPCSDCRAIIAAWPIVKPSGWRVPDGRLVDKETWASLVHHSGGVVTTPGDALVDSDEAYSKRYAAKRAGSSAVSS